MTSEEKSIKLAKLDWYREVISLEPNSKLFLQLARLLAELGTDENNATYMNEAFEVLRRGLSIHPDYMEARLYLIELLNLCGCRSQCGAEVARLASLFLSYPDFWDAWREYAITENESSDFTVALGFMSAIMRNKSLSIVQVLEAGLNALRTTEKPLFSADDLHAVEHLPVTSMSDTTNFAQVENIVQEVLHTPHEEKAKKQENSSLEEMLISEEAQVSDEEKKEEKQKEVVEDNFVIPHVVYNEADETDSLHDVLPKEHVENYKSFSEQQKKKNVSAKQTLAELVKDANIIIEPSENSPFRTKSMADLLAEQGDYKGALDIYQELLSRGYGDKKEIEERIADIKNLCPELNVKIDPSQLLAIDDFVDTSFGLMSKKEKNSEETISNGLDLPINDSYLDTKEEKDTVQEVESEQIVEENTISDIQDEEKSEDTISDFMNEEDSPLVDVPFVTSKKENVEEEQNDFQELMEEETKQEPANFDISLNTPLDSEEQENQEILSTDIIQEDTFENPVAENMHDVDLPIIDVNNEDLQMEDSKEVTEPISVESEQTDNVEIMDTEEDDPFAELDALLENSSVNEEEKSIASEVMETENLEEDKTKQAEEVVSSQEIENTVQIEPNVIEPVAEEVSANKEQDTTMAKFNSDVADILSKLAERLEVRAN